MSVRIAALVLRLPLAPDSKRRRRALETVLREADAHAMRAVARVLASEGREEVCRVWLRPSVSGSSPERWSSPVVAELAGDPPAAPDELVDAAWQDWLTEHDADLWSLLKRWNRPATPSDLQRRALSRLALGEDVALDATLLARASARFDHPIGEPARARLLARGDVEAVDRFCALAIDVPDAVEFCVANHLAPSGDVQRAAFFVRTGQHDQYRALDHDGALLALAYEAAPATERASLRTAMTTFGGIDALRVLAGRRSGKRGLASLAEPERAYLTRRLREQRDWERLWRLTPQLTLAEAVGTVRTFGDWRPSGEDDRRMFEHLRAADPTAVDADVKALTTASGPSALPHTRVDLTDLDKRAAPLSDLDFSPDGTRLAFASLGKCAGTIGIGGEPATPSFSEFLLPVTGVAHLGSDTIVVAESDLASSSSAQCRLQYVDQGGRRLIPLDASHIRTVRRIAGDRAFVVVSDWGSSKLPKPTMSAGAGGGPLRKSDLFQDLEHGPSRVEVASEGGLIAMLSGDAALAADLSRSVVHRLGDAPVVGSRTPRAALSPSVLVRADGNGAVRVWHDLLTSTSEPAIGLLRRGPRESLVDIAWSPALNRFLSVCQEETAHDWTGADATLPMYFQKLEILDVPETRDRPMPGELVSASIPIGGGWAMCDHMRLSPRGDTLAVASAVSATIDLYTVSVLALRPVIGKPMGLMDHSDLANVAAVLEGPICGSGSRTTLELLRACLEHRFRHDVGIGDSTGAVAADDHDIELGR
ncbi:hypothetical protein OHR68_03250 [Spirillospora sp. NBC_00431]